MMPTPLPAVGSTIQVLWDYNSDWWRTGSVVAWNAEKNRHEVAYDDEPEEEPVLEKFWVTLGSRGLGNVARFRLLGKDP